MTPEEILRWLDSHSAYEYAVAAVAAARLIRDLQTQIDDLRASQWTAQQQHTLDKYAVDLAAGCLAAGEPPPADFVARMYDLAEAFFAEGDRRRAAKEPNPSSNE